MIGSHNFANTIYFFTFMSQGQCHLKGKVREFTSPRNYVLRMKKSIIKVKQL